MRQKLLLCLFAVGVAIALPFVAHAAMKVGDPVDPAQTVKTIDGKEVKLAELFKGKPTLLVFFNTACKNCVTELRHVNKLYTKDGKVNVYGIGVDMGGEKVLKVFQSQEQYKYDLLADPDFSVGGAFGFSYTPATVFIDGEGKLKDISTGYGDDSKTKIEAFLK